MQLEVDRPVAATRILLVDDYPDALEIWGLYLRAMGYDVVEPTTDSKRLRRRIFTILTSSCSISSCLALPGLKLRSGCETPPKRATFR